MRAILVLAGRLAVGAAAVAAAAQHQAEAGATKPRAAHRPHRSPNMRHFIAGVATTVLVVAMGVSAFAKTGTVKGQLIDQECYLMEKKVESDATCAVQCAKSGKPVALLTADGKVYHLTGGLAANKNARLTAHMLHTVQITGDVTAKNGTLSIAADALTMVK